MGSRIMEIIILALIVLGIIVIFGKTILLSLSALGGFLSFLVPVAVLITIVYFLTLTFWIMKQHKDYDKKNVRKGPEFKCFNCNKWFDGNEWRYTFSKAWYPFLKYKINFLCGPDCSWEISEKHKDRMIKIKWLKRKK